MVETKISVHRAAENTTKHSKTEKDKTGSPAEPATFQPKKDLKPYHITTHLPPFCKPYPNSPWPTCHVGK